MTQTVAEAHTASDDSIPSNHVEAPLSQHELNLQASEDRLDAAFSTVFCEIENRIRSLEEQGTQPGHLEPYTKNNRVYYNHCYEGENGKPVRKYLSKARVTETMAAIGRHRQVQRLKQMRSEIERIWVTSKGEI